MRLTATSLPQTVYEAALDRVRFVFDNCDDIVVSMSGGKDSTVLYHLARVVAQERGRLPLKVMWLDQEAEWQATVDFMRGVFLSPGVTPYWFQIPLRLMSALSARGEWLYCWRPEDRAQWIRPQDPISIKRVPFSHDRFTSAVRHLATACDTADKQHVGVLVGMRMAESTQRRMSLAYSRSGDAPGAAHSNFKGITWSAKPVGNTRVFWPVYDWMDQDVWVCIAREGLAYNRIYDLFFKYGVPTRAMRVSSLIHENAWTSILQLQEIEPETFDRFLARVRGTSTFAHFERDEIMPHKLPAAFRTWKEYRDYLLENLIEPKRRAAFRKRWQRPSLNVYSADDPDRWYKVHVQEVMINDHEGTLSDKARGVFKLADRKKTGWYERRPPLQ